MRRGRRNRAFTLVEMVVATILLFVGGVAAMICISAATRSISAADGYTRAALLAERRFAEIQSDPTSVTSGEQQGDFGAEDPGFQWLQTVEPTDLTEVSRVTVQIAWVAGSRSRNASFVTYVWTGS